MNHLTDEQLAELERLYNETAKPVWESINVFDDFARKIHKALPTLLAEVRAGRELAKKVEEIHRTFRRFGTGVSHAYLVGTVHDALAKYKESANDSPTA